MSKLPKKTKYKVTMSTAESSDLAATESPNTTARSNGNTTEYCSYNSTVVEYNCTFIAKYTGHFGHPLMATSALLSVIFNAIIILIIFRSMQQKRTQAQLHLVGLAFSDITVSLIYIFGATLSWTCDPCAVDVQDGIEINVSGGFRMGRDVNSHVPYGINHSYGVEEHDKIYVNGTIASSPSCYKAWVCTRVFDVFFTIVVLSLTTNRATTLYITMARAMAVASVKTALVVQRKSTRRVWIELILSSCIGGILINVAIIGMVYHIGIQKGPLTDQPTNQPTSKAGYRVA